MDLIIIGCWCHVAVYNKKCHGNVEERSLVSSTCQIQLRHSKTVKDLMLMLGVNQAIHPLGLQAVCVAMSIC